MSESGPPKGKPSSPCEGRQAAITDPGGYRFRHRSGGPALQPEAISRMTTPSWGPLTSRRQWEGERTWGRSAPGSQSRSTGLSVGRTTALKHPWGSAASGSWPGTALATPNTGCLEPTWSSWSRPDRRVPPRDARNDRGVGVWSKDLRPHPWVGWQTPLGCPGLCCQQLGPTRVGLRRIAVHVRHRRTRKRPGASASGRRRQGRRRGRREHRAAVHPSGTPRRDPHRPGARPARGRRQHCSTTSAPGRSTWSARG